MTYFDCTVRIDDMMVPCENEPYTIRQNQDRPDLASPSSTEASYPKTFSTSSDEASAYKYSKLPNRDSIRLLLLGPESSSGAISCSLIEEPISTLREYSALSYTWGTADTVKEILVNGRQMMVMQTVYDMLEWLSRRGYPQVLWIDSICINQDDAEERAQAISTMTQIFRDAQEICMFLPGFPSLDALRESNRRMFQQLCAKGCEGRAMHAYEELEAMDAGGRLPFGSNFVLQETPRIDHALLGRHSDIKPVNIFYYADRHNKDSSNCFDRADYSQHQVGDFHREDLGSIKNLSHHTPEHDQWKLAQQDGLAERAVRNWRHTTVTPGAIMGCFNLGSALAMGGTFLLLNETMELFEPSAYMLKIIGAATNLIPDTIKNLPTPPDEAIFMLFAVSTTIFVAATFAWAWVRAQTPRSKALACLIALLGMTTSVIFGMKAEEVVLVGLPISLSVGIVASIMLGSIRESRHDGGQSV